MDPHRPPSRPSYVRLELTQPHLPAPPALLHLVGQVFADCHDTLVPYCNDGTVTAASYRKACAVNRSKPPGETHISQCSFTGTPCHRCHSVPAPVGTSISHGDWNWNRILRRLHVATGGPSSRSSGRFTLEDSIPEDTHGRWDDATLVEYQGHAIRHPEKKWEYALMSLWNVTRLADIPPKGSNYHRNHPPNLDMIESDMRRFAEPDTRFLEWLIRNEI